MSSSRNAALLLRVGRPSPHAQRTAVVLAFALLILKCHVAFSADDKPRPAELTSAQITAVSEEWPEFRGPTGQGHSSATALPLEWSADKNVVWKQPVPGSGWSSPVVSRGQIFLTSGTPTRAGGMSLRVLCFDSDSGNLRWNKEVFTVEESALQSTHAKNSPASPTPVVESDCVYVHFGPHGTVCLDRSGNILWSNNRLPYDPVHGNGGSPIVVDDMVVFHGDGAQDPFVVALDKSTGDVRWKVARTTNARQTFSFSTPLLITVNGRRQIVSAGSGGVSALEPATGRELWRVQYGQGYSVVPRPVFGHGLIFVATGYNRADLFAFARMVQAT